MKNEQGRSLTEMLGMLAIMGILSVAGVAMYNSAMNKHRANELIYEAQKRATTVAMQITAGRDTLSIGEFTNPTGYVFGVEKNPNNANQFNITIDTVPSDICTQMKTAVGPATAIRVISNDCRKLTFNNDLSTKAYASDNQTQEACEDAGNTWCGGSASCTDTECCAGKTIGPCEACSEGAVITTLAEGKACDYDGSGTQGVCHLGKCTVLPDTMTCDAQTGFCTCTNGGELCNRATGLCCAPGEACNTNGDNTDRAACVTLQGDCTTSADCTDPDKPVCWGIVQYSDSCHPQKGECGPLGTSVEANIYGLGNIIASNALMPWWSAKNWCEAQGKRLINVEDLQAYVSNSPTLVETFSARRTYACRSQTVCTNWGEGEVNAMWKSNTGEDAKILTDARDSNGRLYSDRYSPVVVDLARHFRGNEDSRELAFWTGSDNAYQTSTHCQSFIVDLSTSQVQNSVHWNPRRALCQ